MPVVSSYQDKAFGGLNGSEGSLEMCLQVRAKCAKSSAVASSCANAVARPSRDARGLKLEEFDLASRALEVARPSRDAHGLKHSTIAEMRNSPMNASIRANHGTRRSGARVGARNFPVRESGATPLRFNALLLAAHNGNVVGHIQRESACKAAGEMDLVAPGRHGRQQCPVSIGDTFVGPRTEIHPEDIVGRRHRERTRADRAGYSKARDIRNGLPVDFQDQVLGRIDRIRQEITHSRFLGW